MVYYFVGVFLLLFVTCLAGWLGMLSQISKLSADRKYLEALNTNLKITIGWHENKGEANTLSTPPALVNSGDFIHVNEEPKWEKRILQSSVFEESSQDMGVSEERTIEILLENSLDPAEEGLIVNVLPADQKFSLPKMMNLPEAEPANEEFLKKLGIESVENDQFTYSNRNEEDIEDILLVQSEFHFTLEDEVKRQEKGSYFIPYKIIEFFAEDLAKCEMIKTGETNMLQHPRLSTLLVGDHFSAYVQFAKGYKVVLGVWKYIPDKSNNHNLVETVG